MSGHAVEYPHKHSAVALPGRGLWDLGRRITRRWAPLGPGLALAAAVAVVATVFGRLLPVVGPAVFGIVIGMLTAPALRRPVFIPGLAFAGKYVLQASVVLLGAGLSLRQIAHTGAGSLPVMLGSLVMALGAAQILGRVLRVESDARTLIGVGTGICGASAIAATTAVIEAAQVQVVYAISTIFVFNIVAVLAFPALGHLLGLSNHAFGLWAGTAINDTSSVVAASYSYSAAAGSHAVVVKLTRALMIIPICAVLAIRRVRRSGRDENRPAWYRLFPWFIGYFVLAAALNTAGLVPVSWHVGISDTALFFTTMALSAIGLSTHYGQLRQAGARPLILGGGLWILVALSSLGLQALTGTL